VFGFTEPLAARGPRSTDPLASGRWCAIIAPYNRGEKGGTVEQPHYDWFRIAEVERDLFVIEEPGHVQSYLVRGRARSALIDTGMGFRDIRAALAPLSPGETIVLNTHWHFDHTGGNALFAQRGISDLEAQRVAQDFSPAQLRELVVKPAQAEGLPLPSGFDPEAYAIRGAPPTFTIAHGDQLDLGGRALEAIATPGHTHGSLSFLDSATGSLLVGDLAYRGAIYAHLDDSDVDEYVATLTMLLGRASEFRALFPAHNEYPVAVSFLAALLEGFRRIEGGTAEGQLIEGWGRPVRRFPFEGFSILLRAE